MATSSQNSQNAEKISVAVDVMGGDFAPAEPVAGAVQAAREQGIDVLLVGDADIVEAELLRHVTDGLNISIVMTASTPPSPWPGKSSPGLPVPVVDVAVSSLRPIWPLSTAPGMSFASRMSTEASAMSVGSFVPRT